MSFFDQYKDDPFIIAEVGQNHQGDVDKALEYIGVFAREGADAVKFQTRDNKKLFCESAYNKEYNSDNAFALTYGEHREKLELPVDVLKDLKKECHKNSVKFMSTPFDENSLDRLVTVGVDLLKIASFDLGNLPFIKKIAQTNLPIVMSIGGGKHEHIEESIKLIRQYNENLSVLHCVSEYPCDYNRLGLDNVTRLIEKFPECAIGLSDHFNGTLSGPVGYMKGARVFEKHVTLNRAWKGTDHSFALEPDGFRKFCRDIRRVRHMMAEKPKDDLGNEYVFKKLGKSIVAAQDLKAGHTLTMDDLSGKIFNETIIPVRESIHIIGKKLSASVSAGQPLSYEDIV